MKHDPGTAGGEGKTLPPLRPPGSGAGSDLPPKPAGGHRLWYAFAFLLLLAVGIVLLLPQWLPPARDVGGAGESGAVPVARPTAQESVAARAQAEAALQSFLDLQAELELANAARWGEPNWSEAVAAAAEGDRLFGERRFAEAGERYQAARQGLQQLRDERPRLLKRALEDGWKALQANDSETAQARFERALALEPGQPEAASGLVRARQRPQVLEFMRQGQQAEAQGRPEAAREAYRQAQQLDGGYAPATQALARVEALLAEAAFRDAMSEALRELDAGRLDAAGRALARAAAVRGDDPAVQATKQRLETARRNARLSRLRRQAAAREGVEEWAAAVGLYQRALAVDARAAFAREGLSRARQRLALWQQIDHYLDAPVRLYSPEPLANARKLLAGIGEVPAGEPRLAGKVKKLQQLVAGAERPQTVTLGSDGETEVVIYHVGRLGRFRRRSVDLLPGDYTVVGSRAGYRDVRREFSVRPGQPTPTIVIRCEERI